MKLEGESQGIRGEGWRGVEVRGRGRVGGGIIYLEILIRRNMRKGDGGGVRFRI